MQKDRGFSLIELLIVIAFLGIVLAMSTPVFTDVVDGMRLGNTARELERELQTARLKSVQTNRDLRVRTNCPAVGQYRILEVLLPGDPRETATNRCSITAFPFPSTGAGPVTRPSFDGPVRNAYRGVTLQTAVVEFHPDGTSTAATIVVTKATKTRSVTINALGKIQLQ